MREADRVFASMSVLRYNDAANDSISILLQLFDGDMLWRPHACDRAAQAKADSLCFDALLLHQLAQRFDARARIDGTAALLDYRAHLAAEVPKSRSGKGKHGSGSELRAAAII